MSCTEFSGDRELLFIDIDGINACGTLQFGSLDHSKADGAEAPNGDGAACMESRVVHHCTPTGRDTAAEDTSGEGVAVFVDFGEGD